MERYIEPSIQTADFIRLSQDYWKRHAYSGFVSKPMELPLRDIQEFDRCIKHEFPTYIPPTFPEPIVVTSGFFTALPKKYWFDIDSDRMPTKDADDERILIRGGKELNEWMTIYVANHFIDATTKHLHGLGVASILKTMNTVTTTSPYASKFLNEIRKTADAHSYPFKAAVFQAYFNHDNTLFNNLLGMHFGTSTSLWDLTRMIGKKSSENRIANVTKKDKKSKKSNSAGLQLSLAIEKMLSRTEHDKPLAIQAKRVATSLLVASRNEYPGIIEFGAIPLSLIFLLPIINPAFSASTVLVGQMGMNYALYTHEAAHHYSKSGSDKYSGILPIKHVISP